MSDERHVVVGGGQVGTQLAQILVEQGSSVVLVTRSGAVPRGVDGVKGEMGDATDRERMTEIATGATVLYNCAAPPYNRWLQDFPPLADSLLGAAEATGAGYVLVGNVYAYGAPDGPMRESDPLRPVNEKTRLRATMWEQALAAYEAGRVRVTEIRSSDYFGPGCTAGSHLGERFIPNLLSGKPARSVLPADQPHSWTYVPDVARAIATIASDERAWGRAWNAPTASAISMVDAGKRLCELADVPFSGVSVMPRPLVRLLGLVVPMLGEMEHIRYQFERPFVLDSSEVQSTFGLSPTPFDQALTETIDWWRSRLSTTGT